MSLKKGLEGEVGAVLRTSTVEKARAIMSNRSGMFVVGIVSFLESALPVPILTDPFLVAAILLNRTKTIWLVLMTMTMSVIGGVVAYLMALLFFDVLMSWMSPEVMIQFTAMANGSNSGTSMLTLVGAVTPVPYTIVAWVVAVMKGSLLVFVIASVVGRGFRYAVVGYSTYRFGALAVSYIKRYIGITSIVVILAALFFWFKM